MEVVRCSSAQEFLSATTEYRSRDPIRTNVLGSVATSVARGERNYEAYWWWLAKEGDDVVGAAFRTAPHGLQLGPMPLNAAQLLAAAVAREDDEFPSVNGSDDVGQAFLVAYRRSDSSGATRVVQRGRKSLIYEVTDLVAPSVEGTCREATIDDFDLVDRWTSAFHLFVEGEELESDDEYFAYLTHRVTSGAIYLWCVGDTPVSMAGHASPVETPSGLVTRVGPVYTPDELRGHGYGSGVSARLSDSLLKRGSRVMLFADADNPTSNSIYQKIGYQFVDDVVMFSLVSK